MYILKVVISDRETLTSSSSRAVNCRHSSHIFHFSGILDLDGPSTRQRPSICKILTTKPPLVIPTERSIGIAVALCCSCLLNAFTPLFYYNVD